MELPYRPFEGRLVRLRAREPEDEPLYHAWINDPDVTEYLSMSYPLSHAAEREWLSSTTKVDYQSAGFAVETLAEGRLIGSTGLHHTRPENREATLGITIGDKACWDGGYGTDAMRVVCRFGFEMMTLHRIQLDVIRGNDRALHVYEKVGFQVEGCRREAHFKHGRYLDVVHMGLLEGELRWD